MQYDEMVSIVAQDLGLDRGIVSRIYKAYWRAIREYIKSLPLKQDWEEEAFKQLRPNVNIPSIGKLYVTHTRHKHLREKNKKITEQETTKIK